MVPSTKWRGRYPFKVEMLGSNLAGITKYAWLVELVPSGMQVRVPLCAPFKLKLYLNDKQQKI